MADPTLNYEPQHPVARKSFSWKRVLLILIFFAVAFVCFGVGFQVLFRLGLLSDR
jgi:hypothetical protein